MTDNKHTLAARLAAVRERITRAEQRYGRPGGSVSLLAISKTYPAEDLRACAELGQRRFGESRVQEALLKIETLADLGLEWHFIGPIQANKTRQIAQHFHWVHGVDRLKIAGRLSDQRPANLSPLNVCLQVNISNEPSKSGVSPAALLDLAAAIRELPRLRLRGLMTLPARSEDPRQQRQAFRALRQALHALNREDCPLDTLSMGMSGDLEAAIAEGATIVRIGSAIFGRR